jgi:pyruvate kinase
MGKHDHLVRRTKIIATLGPATDDIDLLSDIIAAGVNVVRLNFSHGSQADHQRRIENVRAIAARQKKIIGILADLQGPKIRVANFKEKSVVLAKGAEFILDASLDENAGTVERVGIDYKNLPNDVKARDILLLDDGRLRFQVEKVDGKQVICRVLVGGVLSNHKGINRLGGGLTAEALTEKDKQDMQFALQADVDYIAISFPRNAADLLQARQLIHKLTSDRKNNSVGLIAKIERTEAVAAINEIIEASDGVMVARGDLAVEIGDAEVPMVQKEIIRRARRLNKPVIIATQMMESMITNSVPTRAEVSDVANAVLDNADAVMLSAETASGDYPVAVVEAMARICRSVEQQPSMHLSRHRLEARFERIDEAIAMATMYTANHLNIAAIITLTESGRTPLWMSRIRTGIPIYGLSRFDRTLGKMSLYRGVFPIAFNVTQYPYHEINREAVRTVFSLDLVEADDLVILTTGDHAGITGGSNAMKILEVSEVV